MPATVTDQSIASVLAQYPLPHACAVSPIEASKLNDSFLVEDATGNRYLLRRYRRNPEQARVRFQLRFQRELHARGFPTSEVIATASGDPFASDGRTSWALFTFVEGDEYDFSRMGQVAEAGRRLAEFHTLTKSIDLEEVDIEINPHPRRWWTEGEDEIAALERMFATDGVEEEVAYLRRWRALLLEQWPLSRRDALPAGWVHSDFHGRNMVFVGDELRGLFDFDPLHRELWMEDIGHALFMFGREFRGSTHIRSDAARLFLDEYHRERPLASDERDFLPVAVALAWVPSAAYHELLRRDGENTLAYFRHYVQLMRDLRAEMERLAPLLIEA